VPQIDRIGLGAPRPVPEPHHAVHGHDAPPVGRDDAHVHAGVTGHGDQVGEERPGAIAGAARVRRGDVQDAHRQARARRGVRRRWAKPS